MSRALAMLMLLASCDREQRELRLDPAVAAALGKVAVMPTGTGGAPPQVYYALDQPYTSNAYSLSQGKRLYSSFGCRGCHADGRATSSGRPLLDGWWQYGPDVVSIFVSFRDGRAGGMPAYRDRLTTEQIWQLTGYLASGRWSRWPPARSARAARHGIRL
jgi:cytochrome c oxidase cbb3-type subunit 3